MTLKAICFDADGVVVYPRLLFAKLRASRYGITDEMTAPFFGGEFLDCLAGKADLLDVLPPYLSQWGWTGTTEEFIRLWQVTDHVIDNRLVDSIHKLRKQGFICCLATNQENHRAEYMRKEMGFQSIFDTLFFSCDLGAIKPQEAYFIRIEQTINLKGEEILFWDDSPGHIEAARKRGWNAEIYADFSQFQQDIRLHFSDDNYEK